MAIILLWLIGLNTVMVILNGVFLWLVVRVRDTRRRIGWGVE